MASTAVDWDGAKRRAGSSTKCALMSTYVDDCTMDAKAGLAGQLWDMIRFFVSDDPADVQRIVGLTRAEVICDGVSQAALTQETYLESFLETLPEEWAPKRAVKTNGQSTSPPDPKTMEARPCPWDAYVRGKVHEAGFGVPSCSLGTVHGPVVGPVGRHRVEARACLRTWQHGTALML